MRAVHPKHQCLLDEGSAATTDNNGFALEMGQHECSTRLRWVLLHSVLQHRQYHYQLRNDRGHYPLESDNNFNVAGLRCKHLDDGEYGDSNLEQPTAAGTMLLVLRLLYHLLDSDPQ